MENVLSMKPGETVEFAGYNIAFEKVFDRQGPNYQETLGDFQLSRGGKPVIDADPGEAEPIPRPRPPPAKPRSM